MRVLFLILWAVCGWAQSVPSVGAIVDSSGALRPVEGVAGSFLLGPATAPGILSAACLEQLCLAKSDSKILSSTGETDAPSGGAIFGLGDREAIVYFQQTRTFARWHDNTLDPLDWVVDGEVLSIRLLEIAVQRVGAVWIVHRDGSVIDEIADATGPVLLLPEGVLYATDDHIILRRRDRSEVQFELTGAASIAAMGPHYAAIRAGGATYVLRTDPENEKLFLLPGTSP
jgi:hypothetical protein